MRRNVSESGWILLRRVAVALPLLASISLLLSPGAAVAQQRKISGLGDFATYPGLDNIELQYDSIRIVGTTFYLVGDVDLIDSEHDVRLLADEISFNPETAVFEATGRVSFEQGDLLLNGTAMHGDLDDGTMEMENVVGVAPGPFYIRARLVEQLEPGKFRIEKGVVTPCNQTTAIWEFRSGSMIFKPGSYVKMSWPHLRIKGIPILGFPFLYWPLQDSHRQTGLLIPAFGTSNRKGFMFSQSAFVAISRSLDLTLTYEHFANAGNGFGGEFRYALAEGQGGNIRAYYLPGREVTAEERAAGKISFTGGFTLTGAHLQSLPGGFVLRARANLVSSTKFARGFADDVDRFLQRQSLVSADLTKTWGSNTLSIVADHVENFNNDTVSTIGRRLPQVRYTRRSTQVAGPLYISLNSSAARLQKLQKSQKKKGEVIDGGSYERFDAFPDISLQLTQIPWLTFNPFFRWRATYWTHSETKKAFRFSDKSIFRNFFETGVEMVGPSIFKIFEKPGSEYSPRLKHLIQPRLVYRRIHQFKVNANRIIRFDEVDASVRDQQDVRLEFTTRLFAKRYLNRNDEQRQIWQIAELTVGRLWDLEAGTDRLEAAGAPRVLLPYFSNLLIQPTGRLYLRTDLTFSPSFEPASVSLTTSIVGDATGFSLNWFRGVRTQLDAMDLSQVIVQTNSNSLRANANFDLFARRLTVAGGLDMDLLRDRIQSVNASLSWNHQCCSLGLDLRRLNFADRQETQFSFLLKLAQVGDFGFDSHRR